MTDSLFSKMSLVVVAWTTLTCCLTDVVFAQANGDQGFRKLAPGIVTQIGPRIEEDETVSGPRPIKDLTGVQGLEWTPHFSPQTRTLHYMATNAVFRRNIWALEFGFKPLRMVTVNLPDGRGGSVERQVWYLVYYVKNNGRHLEPVPEPDARGNEFYAVRPVNHTVRFFPRFVLQCHDVDRAYLDQVLPQAIEVIRAREDRNREFHDSVSISAEQIPVTDASDEAAVWGIATWVGVDPRTDFFSIYVQGLTNAYQWTDLPDGQQDGEGAFSDRRMSQKTLQLNFWRPGDALDQSETEFRYGIPNTQQVPPGKGGDDLLKTYGVEERVDYQWIYR